MSNGIIIHVAVGMKAHEFFSIEKIRVGSDEFCDVQIHLAGEEAPRMWFALENTEGVYRVVEFDASLQLTINDKPMRRYIAIQDGDSVMLSGTDVSFSFFALEQKSSLIKTNRDLPQLASFIESAALESASSAGRDDAKAFLREFTRELAREISPATKAIALVLTVGLITAIVWIGYTVNNELRESREQSAAQSEVISKLEARLGQTSDQIGQIDKINKDLINAVSLAPNLRVEYGNAVCLIVGVYDLVDRKSGKVLRYADPQALRSNPYEPAENEDPSRATPQSQVGLTTEGNGSTVEYDFIGTGFHVGSGYIVTNRHVLQPWEDDDQVKQMMSSANGRARLRRLVVYFPNVATPFAMKVRQLGARDDVGIATVDAASLPTDIPVIPLDADSNLSRDWQDSCDDGLSERTRPTARNGRRC